LFPYVTNLITNTSQKGKIDRVLIIFLLTTFSSNKWWASKQEYENPTQTKLQHTLMERKNNTNAQKGILQSTITIIIKSKSEIIANP
jgi:glucose-6-phosphate dehydrogenase assembly protein OpcA